MSEPVWTFTDAEFKKLVREAGEIAWDAAVNSMAYPDGSKVELMTNDNPYRKEKRK